MMGGRLRTGYGPLEGDSMAAVRKQLIRSQKLGSFIPTLPVHGLVGVISRSAVLSR
jgi:hypothetical protein